MTNIKEIHLTKECIEDLKRGFFRDGETASHVCLVCGRKFEDGVVYPSGGALLLPERAAKRHVADEHGDVLTLLLDLGKEKTGISEIQESIMRLIHAGRSDREIAAELGGKSASTVRNHRFQLRKKMREAKLFLALMELLEEREPEGSGFIDFNGDVPVSDDRVVVTESEAAGLIGKYFAPGERVRLKRFPRKQKEKLVILNKLADLFEKDRLYTEKEINALLEDIYADYVTVRRYMIDYGFFGRKPDGSAYWRK
jgi:hypothetical protein